VSEYWISQRLRASRTGDIAAALPHPFPITPVCKNTACPQAEFRTFDAFCQVTVLPWSFTAIGSILPQSLEKERGKSVTRAFTHDLSPILIINGTPDWANA
jgi:hypothetical protein